MKKKMNPAVLAILAIVAVGIGELRRRRENKNTKVREQA